MGGPSKGYGTKQIIQSSGVGAYRVEPHRFKNIHNNDEWGMTQKQQQMQSNLNHRSSLDAHLAEKKEYERRVRDIERKYGRQEPEYGNMRSTYNATINEVTHQFPRAYI